MVGVLMMKSHLMVLPLADWGPTVERTGNVIGYRPNHGLCATAW